MMRVATQEYRKNSLPLYIYMREGRERERDHPLGPLRYDMLVLPMIKALAGSILGQRVLEPTHLECGRACGIYVFPVRTGTEDIYRRRIWWHR
jgi:hypothetical protein